MNATTFAMAKKYTDVSIEGTGGVLAGKNAQIASIEDIEVDGVKGKKITFSWFKDDETVARTESINVFDGEQGDQGEKGDQGDPGFSPEITIAEQSATTYKLHVNTGETEYDTPNLKGMGGTGVDVAVDEEELKFTY